MSDARLTWGSTSLIPTPAQEAEYRAGTRAFLIEVVEGTNFGNPEAQVTAIRSHLQDGSLASITSFDNRQGPLQIRVRSKTYVGLDAGGKALATERNVPGFSTLTWTPNVSLAYPTVFDVVYADLGWKFDDLGETKVGNGEVFRYFEASIESLPFGRDATRTTVQATTGTGTGSPAPTITSINDASSTAGWTATPDTLMGSNGKVSVATSGGVFGNDMYLELAATTDVTSTRFIFVEYTTPVAGTSLTGASVAAGTGGTVMPMSLVASSVGTAAGYTRAYFQLPSGFGNSVARFNFQAIASGPDGGSLVIDQVSRSTGLPPTGTNRQQSRSLMVGGSARARATLAIAADAGKTLGDLTILYTRSATTGLQPPLRPYRASSAAVTTDATLISGAYQSLGTTPTVFTVPANRFREAAHDLVLRMRATTFGTYTVTYTAALVSSANADIPETVQSITGTTSVTFAAASTWQTAEIGLLQLPTVPVAADSTHMIRLTLIANNAVVQLDEAWLFDLDNGVLSWVNTTGLTRLEARTADINNPEPSYWGGTVDGGAATGLVRADWRVQSFGAHTFEPGSIDVFTVTSGTEGSSCSAMFFKAFLHTASAA